MSASNAPGQPRRGSAWWIVVVVWMVTIFVLSSQPDLGFTDGRGIHIGVYKLAHLVEFAVLGVSVRAAIGHLDSRREAWWTSVILVLYAITDEIHQAFVPGRTPLVTDVAIDSLGGLLGILAYAATGRVQGVKMRSLARHLRKRPPIYHRATARVGRHRS